MRSAATTTTALPPRYGTPVTVAPRTRTLTADEIARMPPSDRARLVHQAELRAALAGGAR